VRLLVHRFIWEDPVNKLVEHTADVRVGDDMGPLITRDQFNCPWRVAQRERQAVLAPGDFMVFDTSEPYRLCFESDCAQFVVMFPRTALKMPENGIASITAVPIRADRGVGALVSPFLNSLRQGLSTGSLHANPRLEEAAIDLICASLTDNASQINGGPGAAILASARSFIDTHHADPALSPSMVAAAHPSRRATYKSCSQPSASPSPDGSKNGA